MKLHYFCIVRGENTCVRKYNSLKLMSETEGDNLYGRLYQQRKNPKYYNKETQTFEREIVVNGVPKIFVMTRSPELVSKFMRETDLEIFMSKQFKKHLPKEILTGRRFRLEQDKLYVETIREEETVLRG